MCGNSSFALGSALEIVDTGAAHFLDAALLALAMHPGLLGVSLWLLFLSVKCVSWRAALG